MAVNIFQRHCKYFPEALIVPLENGIIVSHVVLFGLLLSWGASLNWPWFLSRVHLPVRILVLSHWARLIALGGRGDQTKEEQKRTHLASGCDSLNIKIQLQCEQNNCQFDLGRLSGVMHTLTCLTAWRTPAQSSNCGFWHCLSLQHVWGFWRAAGCSSALCFCPSPDRNLNPSFEFRH